MRDDLRKLYKYSTVTCHIPAPCHISPTDRQQYVRCLPIDIKVKLLKHPSYFSSNDGLSPIESPSMMFDSLVCPLSSDPEEAEEERKDSFEIFKGSTKSLCEEVLTTKT